MAGLPGAVSIALQVISLILLLAGAGSFVLLVQGCLFLRRFARVHSRDDSVILLKSPLVPAVSMIVVPPDDSQKSRDLARRLADLHFGTQELVLVLDGPSESEMETWSREFRLGPATRTFVPRLPTARIRGVYTPRDPMRLVVVDKEQGGEGDAYNAGLNAASAGMIGLLDPDCDFEPTVLLGLIGPLLDAADEVVAVCGLRPVPPSDGWACWIGALESLRLWLARGAAFASRGMLAPIPGAFVLVRRDAILEAGGFTAGPLELILHLHGLARKNGKSCRVAFVPDAATHSPMARSLGDLRELASRDQEAIARALRQRKKIAAGWLSLGWRGLPALFVVRLLRPLLETVAYILVVVGLVLHWFGPSLAFLVLLSSVAMGIVVSMGAVALRELAEYSGSDPGRLAALFFSAIPENLGYRQVRNLWLIAAYFRRGKK
jgi:cellulose synthase/poly-beta-1,6-N-acetylglucosamine synthase-like glycosyltransferase